MKHSIFEHVSYQAPPSNWSSPYVEDVQEMEHNSLVHTCYKVTRNYHSSFYIIHRLLEPLPPILIADRTQQV